MALSLAQGAFGESGTPSPPTLAEALDTPGWAWTTGGGAEWAGQTQVTHDGVDAARSGALNGYGESWLETAVTGPGQLSFWWKASFSDFFFEALEFSIDGHLQRRLSGEVDSGEVDWEQRTYVLGSGTHELRWRYANSDPALPGLGAGFVDQVAFVPGVFPPSLTVVPAAGITPAGATLGGTVTSDGGAAVTERGVVYALSSVNGSPESGGAGVTKATAAGSANPFEVAVAGLTESVAYTFRAYATNSAGTGYSEAASFVPRLIAPLPDGFAPLIEGTFGWGMGMESTNAAIPQADGKILIGGDFTSVEGLERRGIARFHADGTLDEAFNPSANGPVFSLAPQGDGKILIAGEFTSVDSAPRHGVARLNADGSLDSGFDPGVNGPVLSIAVQSDGKILIGGWFGSVGGTPRSGIARLNADGTLDAGFNPGDSDNGDVRSIALQGDGRVLMGGGFTSLGGVERSGIARLHVDGTLDAGFDPDIDGGTRCFALQGDGGILVGGWFTRIDGIERNGIARLNADGSLDEGFAPGIGGSVNGIVLQGDGKVLVGRGHFGFHGADALVRLNADGTRDAGFNPEVQGRVSNMALQDDGKILVSGSLDPGVDGEGNYRVWRMHAGGSASRSLTAVGTGRIEWLRGGSCPEVEQVRFALNAGGQWQDLGAAERIPGGWRLSGLGLPEHGEIRAQGRAAGGDRNGSSYLVEQAASYSSAPGGLTLPAGYTVFRLEPGHSSVGVSVHGPTAFGAKIAVTAGPNQSHVELAGAGEDIGSLLDPNGAYYLEVGGNAGPALVGARFEVDVEATQATSDTTLVLLPGSPTNTMLEIPDLTGLACRVRKHLTLAGVFGGSGDLRLHGTGLASASDQVMFFDPSSGSFRIYWLRANAQGTVVQWRTLDDSDITDYSNLPIPPGTGVFVYRQPSQEPVDLFISGEVRTVPFRHPLPAGYSLISHAAPVDHSPRAAGMTKEDGWTGTGLSTASDQIHRWNGSGFDVFWFRSDFSGSEQEWRRVDEAAPINYLDEILLRGDEAIFVRKQGAHPGRKVDPLLP